MLDPAGDLSLLMVTATAVAGKWEREARETHAWVFVDHSAGVCLGV